MSVVQHAPSFDQHEAAGIARSLFDVSGTTHALPSERDQNFRIETTGGQAFVLKIANALESRELLDAQTQALEHITARSTRVLCPRVVKTVDGLAVAHAEGPDGRQYLVRMLIHLPGVPLATVKPRTAELMLDLGRFMGELDRALDGFDHVALHREFHWDVARAARVIHELREEIEPPERRHLVEDLLRRFESETAPALEKLRRVIIHGDANDHNVLVGGKPLLHNQTVAGILDFGDMIWSCLVCEPAVAVAYALLGEPDPLAVAAQVVSGYHQAQPLHEAEIAALWDLICMRLCMSVCHATHQRRLQPANEYLSISETPAWEALSRLHGIHPRLAHYSLRDACGLPACPDSTKVVEHVRRQADHVAPVIEPDVSREPVHVLDLSVASPLLSSRLLMAAGNEALTQAVFDEIKRAGKRVGIGRYDEVRALYSVAQFGIDASPTGERRTVHLGIDLFVPADRPVRAPIDGVVHTVHDNARRHDYGPVVILRHATGDGTRFFTLYGHLSRSSIDGLRAGAPIKAGDRIGSVGSPPTNGDWPPHVHFQIIVDLLDLGCDFPGVAAPSHRAVYLSLSPNPNLLLRVPDERVAASVASKEQTLAGRRQRIGPNLSIAYRTPLKIVRGLGVYLYDEGGRAYLDCVNNVAHVGHCHPQVVAAGQRQMALLNTNTRYLHDSIVEYARRLSEKLPEPLRVCFFLNSGSEANDLALRLARTATGRQDIITVDSAYHGHTQALIDVSPYKHDGPGGKGRPPYVHKVPMPDPYRGQFRGYSADSGLRYADHVQSTIEEVQAGGRGVAAFICESMMGCGGQIIFPDGFMGEAFRHVRASGGLCIADEVQTGFGRAGTHFWAFETQGVVPDIVTMGKPAGNGHPLAIVVTSRDIADRFANGMEYFNTFGGNAVSCEIGLAVLDVIERERLQENSRVVGSYLLDRLSALIPAYPVIGDVRGVGLFIGVELVLDQETRDPAGLHAAYVANRMRDLGVLVSTDGPDHNVLKIKPPIVFSKENADHLVNTLASVLYSAT
ncbi:MAG: aminotransferase class III-fold pyridoxal phosphate-dependent enzyme [Acidobacteriota bacterium]